MSDSEEIPKKEKSPPLVQFLCLYPKNKKKIYEKAYHPLNQKCHEKKIKNEAQSIGSDQYLIKKKY